MTDLTPRYPEEPSERELYLSMLTNSDEDTEALLSGGADVDDLTAAGVLDDYEPDGWGWQTVQKMPDLTDDEVEALISQLSELWGLDLKGYRYASDQPH